MYSLFRIFTLLLLFSAGTVAQPSGFSPGSDHADLRLVCIPMADLDSDAITLQNPHNNTLLTGLYIDLEEGWHTYWQNPGDSGIPARINWELPDGFESGELRWPYPQSFEEGHLLTYGYKEESFLYQPVTVGPEVSSGRYELHADVEFLVCREACLPGFERLSLSVEVRNGRVFPVNNVNEADLFRRFLPALPQQTGHTGSYRQEGNQLYLSFPSGLTNTLSDSFGTDAEGLELYFYASAENVTEASAPQEFSFQDEGFTAVLQVSRYRNAPLDDQISGVLVAVQGNQTQAYELLFN